MQSEFTRRDAADAEPRGPRPGRNVPHLHVEMKPIVVVGSPTVVRVRLTRGHATSDAAAARGADHHGDVDVGDQLDAVREVEVAVVPRGFRFAAGARRTRHLRLPSGHGEVEAAFRIVGVAPGRGEVSVVVRQHTELPLATLRLTAQVVNADGSGITGLVRQAVPLTAPDAQLAGRPAIRVDEELAGTRSTMHMAVAVGGRSHRFTTRLRDKLAYVAGVHARIAEVREELANAASADRPELGRRRMQQLGTSLFQDLFDSRARELLWQHRDELDGVLVQTTGEVDLPWELVHLAQPGAVDPDAARESRFLAEYGLTRWVYDTARPTSIPIRPGRCYALNPVDAASRLALRPSGADGGGIRSPFALQALAPDDARALRRVVSGGFDLLHITGRLRWSGGDTRRQELVFDSIDPDRASNRAARDWENGWPNDWTNDASYTDDDVRRDLPDHPVPGAAVGPVVLLDASDVDGFVRDEVGLGGFTDAFLRGGVGALVVRSWSLGDETGRFAEVFSEALAAGRTIGDATHEARAAALTAGDQSDLAFAVYGHPLARLHVG
jgi:hypothetical protein